MENVFNFQTELLLYANEITLNNFAQYLITLGNNTNTNWFLPGTIPLLLNYIKNNNREEAEKSLIQLYSKILKSNHNMDSKLFVRDVQTNFARMSKTALEKYRLMEYVYQMVGQTEFFDDARISNDWREMIRNILLFKMKAVIDTENDILVKTSQLDGSKVEILVFNADKYKQQSRESIYDTSTDYLIKKLQYMKLKIAEKFNSALENGSLSKFFVEKPKPKINGPLSRAVENAFLQYYTEMTESLVREPEPLWKFKLDYLPINSVVDMLQFSNNQFWIGDDKKVSYRFDDSTQSIDIFGNETVVSLYLLTRYLRYEISDPIVQLLLKQSNSLATFLEKRAIEWIESLPPILPLRQKFVDIVALDKTFTPPANFNPPTEKSVTREQVISKEQVIAKQIDILLTLLKTRSSREIVPLVYELINLYNGITMIDKTNLSDWFLYASVWKQFLSNNVFTDKIANNIAAIFAYEFLSPSVHVDVNVFDSSEELLEAAIVVDRFLNRGSQLIVEYKLMEHLLSIFVQKYGTSEYNTFVQLIQTKINNLRQKYNLKYNPIQLYSTQNQKQLEQLANETDLINADISFLLQNYIMAVYLQAPIGSSISNSIKEVYEITLEKFGRGKNIQSKFQIIRNFFSNQSKFDKSVNGGLSFESVCANFDSEKERPFNCMQHVLLFMRKTGKYEIGLLGNKKEIAQRLASTFVPIIRFW